MAYICKDSKYEILTGGLELQTHTVSFQCDPKYRNKPHLKLHQHSLQRSTQMNKNRELPKV